MRSLGTKFGNYKDREGSARNYVLALTDGSDMWYFSRWPIDLTNGECYPIISSRFSITEGVNWKTRKWRKPKLSISLNNAPFERDSGASTWSRPSDILVDLHFNEAKLYLSVGPEIDTLADMEIVFAGIIENEPETSTRDFKIVVDNYDIERDLALPLNIVGDTYSTTEPEWYGDPIPIAYGKYTFDWDYWGGDGLAVAIPTNSQRRNYIIADHELNAFTEIYAIEDRTSDPAEFQTRTLNIDDSGRGTASSVSRTAELILWPSTEDACDDFDDAVTVQSFYDPIDRSTITQDSLTNNFVEGSDITDTDPEGLVMMAFGEQAFLREVADFAGTFKFRYKAGVTGAYSCDDAEARLYYYSDPDNTLVASMAYDNTLNLSASWLALPKHYRYVGDPYYSDAGTGSDDMSAGGTYLAARNVNTRYWVRINATGTPDTFNWNDDNGNSGTSVNCSASSISLSYGVTISFTSTTGHATNDAWTFTAFAEEVNHTYALAIWCQGDENELSNPPGTIELLRLYDMSIVVRFGVRNAKSYWAALDGLPFDSWATTRSTNYSAGDCIEDPAQIIHSLLRDIMGLGDTEIDHASFDDCENTSVKARINLHENNRLSLNKAMSQLAEQSTFAVYWQADGTARAFTLNDKTPTADRTFTWEDIVADSLRVKKTIGITNKLRIRHRYQQEYKTFRAFSGVDDTTSQTAFGTHKYEAKWPNLAGTSTSHVAALLVNSTDGIWSKEHYQITFESPGWKDFDLQCGDYVSMDNDSVGARLSCRGDSWANREFLIIEITYTPDSIKYTAVELF